MKFCHTIGGISTDIIYPAGMALGRWLQKEHNW